MSIPHGIPPGHEKYLSGCGSVVSGNPSVCYPKGLQSVVCIYEACAKGPKLLQQITTSDTGCFNYKYRSNAVVYAVAQVVSRPGLLFLYVFPPKAWVSPCSQPIVINEATTVAATWAFARLYRMGSFCGSQAALNVARSWTFNLCDAAGGFSSVLATSPNGFEGNTFLIFNNLCNLLAGIAQGAICLSSLAALTLPQATNSLDMLNYVARYPWNNVAEIYALTTVYCVYPYVLSQAPVSFAFPIKVNKTGNPLFVWGGPGNFVFDSRGRLWVTNNVTQGLTTSSPFSVVLEEDGTPASFSPLTRGGLFGGGFGVTIDSRGNVWKGNFGWGQIYPEAGSVSKFSPDGQALSPESGITKDTYRVQGMATDSQDGIWMCSYGNDRVVLYPKGDPAQSVFYQFPATSYPFGMVVDGFDDAICTLGTIANSPDIPRSDQTSAIVKLRRQKPDGSLALVFRFEDASDPGATYLGVCVDSQNCIYAANETSSFIICLDPCGCLLRKIMGAGISNPWGISVDGDDNLLVANFGTTADPNLGPYALSYVDRYGNALSPPNGFVVESGGGQVLLSNGLPLYGNEPVDGNPCFSPLMRQTIAKADCAGNVWVTNNFKPNLAVDFLTLPGGDGLVVFVGLASPVARPSVKPSRRHARPVH
jgi:hypothetical protein